MWACRSILLGYVLDNFVYFNICNSNNCDDYNNSDKKFGHRKNEHEKESSDLQINRSYHFSFRLVLNIIEISGLDYYI